MTETPTPTSSLAPVPPVAGQPPTQAAELARVAAEAEANGQRIKAERDATEERARQADRDRIAAQRPTPESVAGKYEDFGHVPPVKTIEITDHGTIRTAQETQATAEAENKRLAAEHGLPPGPYPAPVDPREPSNLTPEEKAEYESHRPAPAPVKDVVRTPEEAMRANLEAPGHKVGDAIEGDLVRADCGLFQCGIDALGRVWRIEDGGDGKRLVLAGWLNT